METAALDFAHESVARPAAKVRRMRMIGPHAVRRQNQRAVRPQDPAAFVEIPGDVPHVLEDLCRQHDRAGARSDRQRAAVLDPQLVSGIEIGAW